MTFQSSHIYDQKQRLKHVRDRLDVNDEVSNAFESLLMVMFKQLQASGNIVSDGEVNKHIEEIENAKVCRLHISTALFSLSLSLSLCVCV